MKYIITGIRNNNQVFLHRNRCVGSYEWSRNRTFAYIMDTEKLAQQTTKEMTARWSYYVSDIKLEIMSQQS